MNKKIATSIFSTALLVFFIVSCDKKVGKNPSVVASPPPPPGACDTITYNKHIKPIMVASCEGCHGGSGGVNLNTYTQVKAQGELGRLKARVIDGNPSYMPTGGSLPQAQKDLIQCWLNNGYKE